MIWRLFSASSTAVPRTKRPFLPLNFRREWAFRATAVFAAWFSLGLPAAITMTSYADTTLSDAGEIVGDGKIVVLKPERWVGKRLPVARHIDIGRELSRGVWIVLFVHDGCSACREAVPEYEALARELSARDGCPKVALVECQPRIDQKHAVLGASTCTRGNLSRAKRWIISTPAALLIDEGKVQTVFESPGDVKLLKSIWANQESA